MPKISGKEDFDNIEVQGLKKEYFRQVEAHTPEDIKNNRIFDLKSPNEFKLILTKEFVEKYKLRDWLANYRKEAAVSTGGVRGAQNVLYPWDTRFKLNQLGVALATLAKAEVLKEDIKDRVIQKICSGEVRYNTDDYIKLITRIQAAYGIRTHTPFNKSKTSIWMTSFLTFMNDYDGGEYVTSSHAISSKIATKDLDNQGSQFVPEMSARFVKKIQDILDIAEESSYEIVLSHPDSELITEDFDGIDQYIDYLKKGVATKTNIELIKAATDNGLEIMLECVGGCMHKIMLALLKRLGIENTYSWNNIEYDPFFHGIGKVMKNPVTKNVEFFDWGCDTTIPEVMFTMGYQRLLKDKPIGYFVILFDPDGDRIVLAQVESTKGKEKLESLGIEYIMIDENKLVAYYTPNQSFFLTMEFHATQLKAAGLWDNHPRFIITTTASASSWVEWAGKLGIKVLYVPVGFKEIANMMKKIEKQIIGSPDSDVIVEDIFGNNVNLGIDPRLVFAGEESGGMITGPEELIKSRNGRIAIAMREKSAGEASIIVSAMAAKLHNENKMISDYLDETFEKYGIIRRYDIRKEIKFFNESEPNPEKLKESMKLGESKRDKTDNFYLGIALSTRFGKITQAQAKEILIEALPELNFDNFLEIFFVGDGTYIDFKDKYVEIRKSGTDAIIKGYSAGQDKKECIRYANIMAGYSGELTPKFKRWISVKMHKTCKDQALTILKDFQKI